jgi:hypothetical protein
MSKRSTTVAKSISNIDLSDEFDQAEVTQFFLSIQQALSASAEETHSLFQFHSPISYKDERNRKKWLEKVNSVSEYDLNTCDKAVRSQKLGSKINYWICYSYPGPIFERTSTYFGLIRENASESEIEEIKAHHKFDGLIWHAVLVKFHNKTVSF